jgi:hypothetical protein
MKKHWLAAALVAIVSACPAATANAAVILITQAKAQAGNVTPGDAAGFPVWITQPGSYRLDTNLTGTVNQSAIEVRAPDVTIDLNGFRIDGAGVAYNGILGRPVAHRVTIRNGTITGFRVDGINGSAGGDFWTVENMLITGNSRDGVRIHDLGRILNNTIARNDRRGAVCSDHCLIESNIISENGEIGVIITVGNLLGNSIENNVGFGIDAQEIGYGNNFVRGNNLDGDQFDGSGTQLHPNACTLGCP